VNAVEGFDLVAGANCLSVRHVNLLRKNWLFGDHLKPLLQTLMDIATDKLAIQAILFNKADSSVVFLPRMLV